MKLADMLKNDWFGRVATATVATVATLGPKTPPTVASVATVAVANSPETKTALASALVVEAVVGYREASTDPGHTGHQTGQALQCSGSLSPVGGVAQPLQRKSSPTTETSLQRKTPTTDWKTLDRAYQAHHATCPTCIAAGKGYGLRCGTGAALWADYDRDGGDHRQRKSAPQPAPARQIDPSLLTPATAVEINTMAKRLALFAARGLTVDDAEKLADRLMLRDRDQDRRGACAECVHLAGSGPGRWRCGDTGGSLVAVVVHLQLHHCPSLRMKPG